MRDLAALQSTPAGRRFLEGEGVFDDPEAFLAALRPPATGGAGWPVYVHQQTYLDYRASVVAKVLALRDLQRRRPDLVPEFLWIDTDRAGSDKLSLRLYLEGAHGPVAVRLAPTGCEDQEPRTIQLEAARLAAGVAHIEAILRARAGGGDEQVERFAALRPLFGAEGTLADLSRRLTSALFRATLDFEPRPRLVSDLIADGALTATLTLLLNRQPAFVAAVNARIAELQALDVDPHLKPLPADYLPLFIRSPVAGRRLRLRLEQDGALRLAVAREPDGTRHRFELGRGELGMTAPQDAIWSPDVTLPLLVSGGYSGLVAGRSSALYLLVLQAAAQSALGLPPLPVLVPRDWASFGERFDSLFAARLDGRRF